MTIDYETLLAQVDDQQVISTGFDWLNKTLDGGFRRGEMMMLRYPPRPSEFKSAMYYHAARAAGLSLRACLEMPELQLAMEPARGGNYELRAAQAEERRRQRVEELFLRLSPTAQAIKNIYK